MAFLDHKENEMQRFWILEAKSEDELPRENPWEPWYDTCSKMVVCAANEMDARHIASLSHADEGEEAWLLDKWSTCKIIKPKENDAVIIRDVSWA